jgi:hypothetical protein
LIPLRVVIFNKSANLPLQLFGDFPDQRIDLFLTAAMIVLHLPISVRMIRGSQDVAQPFGFNISAKRL